MVIGRHGEPRGEAAGYVRSLGKLRGLKHLLIPAGVTSNAEFNAAVETIRESLQKMKLPTEPEPVAKAVERKEPDDKPNRMHTGGHDRSDSE